MKIQIKGAGKNLSIPVPDALLFSKVSVWLYTKFIRKTGTEAAAYAGEMPFNLSEEAMYAILKELKKAKKKHGSWTLVEVQSAAGDEVIITM